MFSIFVKFIFKVKLINTESPGITPGVFGLLKKSFIFVDQQIVNEKNTSMG